MATLQRQITINDANYSANQAFAEDGTASELDTTGMSRRAIINALSLKFVKFTRNPGASLTMLSDNQLNTLAQISDAVVNEFNAKGANTNYRGEPIDSQLFIKDLMEMMGANNLGNMAMKQKEAMLRTPQLAPSAPKADTVQDNNNVDNFVPVENEVKIKTNVGNVSNHSKDKRKNIQLDSNNLEVKKTPEAPPETPPQDTVYSRISKGVSNAIDLFTGDGDSSPDEKKENKDKKEEKNVKKEEKKDSGFAKHFNEHVLKAIAPGFARNKATHNHLEKEYNDTMKKFDIDKEGQTALHHIHSNSSLAGSKQERWNNVTQAHLVQVRDNLKQVNGLGFKRRKNEKQKRGRVMYGTGLRPFGHYNLDMHDLDRRNRVTLRYKNNRKVHTVPSNLVGGNLIACLKSVVEGKNPSYKDVSSLTDAEKDYLNEIGNKAEIDELSQIKSGTKDEEDRDMHQFQVLTGEISAGNDSKQLVADYKKLMLKLMSKGRIDRNSGKSILMDLAVIGY
jgi:hypothetical protein